MYVFKIWNHLLDTVVPTDPAKKRDFFARRMGKLTTKLLRLYIPAQVIYRYFSTKLYLNSRSSSRVGKLTTKLLRLYIYLAE